MDAIKRFITERGKTYRVVRRLFVQETISRLVELSRQTDVSAKQNDRTAADKVIAYTDVNRVRSRIRARNRGIRNINKTGRTTSKVVYTSVRRESFWRVKNVSRLQTRPLLINYQTFSRLTQRLEYVAVRLQKPLNRCAAGPGDFRNFLENRTTRFRY